jgi:hypothetical protein
MLAAAAGALAPVMDSLAKRRRRRDREDEDDNDDELMSKRQLLQRRRRREREDDDDDDNDALSLRARRQRRREREADDDDDDGDDGAAIVSRKQSIVGDLGINEIVQDRIDTALSRGGGGGGDGDANIVVSQDGDVLTVLTSDIEFAGDSEGFEVETGGISYSSGAGGGLLEDDFLS